jgi:hypothetical protein
MARNATVVVRDVEGVISCEPETVQLYYRSEPNAIEWTFEKLPEGTDWVTVTFEGGPMFRDVAFSMKPDGTARLCLFNYLGGPKATKYTLRFYNSAKELITECDPHVVADPDNPWVP